MAYYAALASAMELLDDILRSNSLLASSHTLKSLQEKICHLMDSLQVSSFKRNDEAADHVETQIRDTAYQVLDIIEFQIPKQQISSEFEKSSLSPQLQKLGKKVDSIVQEMNAMKESQMLEDLQLDSGEPGTEQNPTTGGTIVGFEDPLKAIKEELCGSSSQLQVIPIVGMGGIGKTTLARNAFEDPLIVSEFDFRGWVTVSQDYDVITILLDIVKSLSIVVPDELSGGEDEELKKSERDNKTEEEEEEVEPENEMLEEKQERKIREIEKKRERKKKELEMRRTKRERGLKLHIHQHLKGRKFLMVTDDVWNEEICDYIKQIFPNEHTESRILLTTRLAELAEYSATTDFLQEMQILNTEASWTLLQEKAFGQDRCPPELVHIGKLIASKCQGLPLAIVVIGGILSNDKTLRHGKNVAADVGFVLRKDDNHLSKIFSLSYNHLPHQLKACFLHMGIFPEDYEIDISKLIKLWIAEGFLKSGSTSKSLERVGEEYFEDLVKRSLVIITKKRVNGQFKSCVMHDLLRDFCRWKGTKEYFFQYADQEGHFHPSGVEKVRRISIVSDTVYMPQGYENGKYVRSFCWFSKWSYSNFHGLDWGSIKRLRILDIADIINLTSVAPFAVSKMFDLEYLAFKIGSNGLRSIPKSISKFQNLETLIILAPNCKGISLPSEIWKMARLKHLIIDRMILPPVKLPLPELEYLQTLETIQNFLFTDKVTQMIPNVRKLKLRCRGEKAIDVWNSYRLKYLAKMLQLEKLNISFYDTAFSSVGSSWSSFMFPLNLKKLSLEACYLPWEALTLVGFLKSLQVLRLRVNAFIGEVWEPVEGEFLELRFLLLEDLYLQQWIIEKAHFPKLEHLKIIRCRGLEIPLDIGEIEALRIITVHGSKLAGASARKIQEYQREELGYEGLQVIVQD